MTGASLGINVRSMRGCSRSRSLLSTLIGVWFLVSSLASGAMVPCPMHGDTPSSGQPAAHASHATDAGLDPHAGHVPSAPTPVEGESSHPCDCGMSCCSVPPLARLDPPAGVVLAAPVSTRAPAPASIPLPSGSRVRLLPFAIGPPAPST